MEDKAKGRMKEAAGAVTDDEEKKSRGPGPAEEGPSWRGGRAEGENQAG